MCGRSYKSLVYLRRHESVHQGTTRCPACNQVYSSVSNLQQHMRSVHDLPLPEGRTARGRRRLAREALMGRLSEDRAREALIGLGQGDEGRDGGGERGTGRGRGRGRGRPGGPAKAEEETGGGDEEWPEASQAQWLGHFASD